MATPKYNFSNIPNELKQLKQWIVWRYEDVGAKKPTKVPYNCNNYPASVTNVSDWMSFNDAVSMYDSSFYDGIGFVFTEFDPYAFIDLDDCEGNEGDLQRQLVVSREFNSYSEQSPSGQGLHIIIKGSIPQGRKRSHIEIYSNARYATMTGNVFNPSQIGEYHELLNSLYKQMGGGIPQTFSHTGNEKENQSDTEIREMAEKAVNGDKFRLLYGGEWQSLYPSQSEADFALIDIIAFYTQNRSQITRIFKLSSLGRRDKANRQDYIDWMINKSFDRILPKIDFDGWRTTLEVAIEEKQLNNIEQLQLPLPLGADKIGVSENEQRRDININDEQRRDININDSSSNNIRTNSNDQISLTPPPGLVGDIARFIYEAAPRPVPEIAIAAAIGLMAGICGRAYNISATGLNHYVLLLADTGSGKEGAKSGIDKLINAVKFSVPVANEFIGPAQLNSGQALLKYLYKNNCFVSVLGEFGLRLQSMSSNSANPAERKLKEVMLDLYNKSGFYQNLEASIYSETDKNIPSIQAPSFSLFGESVPSEFYNALSEDTIAGGLLPRFLIIEYTGYRVGRNKDHDKAQPSLMLVDTIAQLMANAKTIMANRKVTNVEITKEAEVFADNIDKLADSRINSADKQIVKHLWNRAHIKTLKLSALIAVGCNIYSPRIELEHVKWAYDLIEYDIKALSAKFEAGLIGKSSEELRQAAEMTRMIYYFVTEPWERIKSYGVDQKLFSNKIVPYLYLNRRLSNISAFKSDKIGATNAIKRTIQNMIDGDYLREASKKEMQDKFGTTQRAFVITNVQEFLKFNDAKM